MNPMFAASAVALACALILLGIVFTRVRLLRERLTEIEREREAFETRLRQEAERERANTLEAQSKIETWIGEKTEAETRLQETERRLAAAVAERDKAIFERDAAMERKNEAEQDAALRRQELADIKRRMEDWETAKAESLQAAKAAVLSTASEVSSKLLDDHKRESAEAKREAEERVRKTTEDLVRQIDEINKAVAALNKQVDENRDTMATVWRALSSPGGAGQFAEIGLENTLKSFGLQRGRDFLIQQTVEGKRLRPDAIVLLPGDTVLVVDSKASKYLLDLAEVVGTEWEDEAYRNLARTMNLHLKSLADKNYKAEILASYREAGRTGEIKRILSVMYLPNEGAVEKLARADSDFIRKATKLEMIVAGPSALACLIGFARVEIDLGRQIENREQIVQGTQALLDSVGVVVEHTEKLGRGLRTAAQSYVDLTSSINARLLPRAHSLLTRGVRPARHKPIPKSLPVYQVVQLENGALIEGEAEEVGGFAVITDRTSTTN